MLRDFENDLQKEKERIKLKASTYEFVISVM